MTKLEHKAEMKVAEFRSIEPKEETILQLQIAKITIQGRDVDGQTARTQGRDQNVNARSHNAQKEGTK